MRSAAAAAVGAAGTIASDEPAEIRGPFADPAFALA